MISLFMLECQEKASECLKYGKTIWNFLQQVQCRFIQSTDIRIAFCCLVAIKPIADQMHLIFGCEL